MELNRWFKGILAQVDAVQIENTSPKMKAGGKETVVGVLEDEFLRKLFVLRGQLTDKVEKIRTNRTGHTTFNCAACTEARLTETKIEFLENLFWPCLRGEFGLEDKSAVGVRTNWEVVWFDSDGNGISIIDVGLGFPGRRPDPLFPLLLMDLLERERPSARPS